MPFPYRQPPPAQDKQVAKSPTDTITALRWAPNTDASAVTPVTRVLNSNSSSRKSSNSIIVSPFSHQRRTHQLAATSWDGSVSVYTVTTGGGGGSSGLSAERVVRHEVGKPLFSCDWAADGGVLAAAGADCQVHLLDAATGEKASFAAHDAPVRGVRFVVRGGGEQQQQGSSNLLATGSWDCTVRLWDLRAMQTPVKTYDCGHRRVYALDVAAGGLLVTATADASCAQLLDLRGGGSLPLEMQPLSTTKATAAATAKSSGNTALTAAGIVLPEQIRAVAVNPEGGGWAAARIDGRCAVQEWEGELPGGPGGQDGGFVDPGRGTYTFKCHRQQATATARNGGIGPATIKVYAVNDICYHPLYPSTLCTAGSDGTFSLWDWPMRRRLFVGGPAASSSSSSSSNNSGTSTGDDTHGSLTAAAFSSDGSVLAYAVGYDWSRGFRHNSPTYPQRLMLHALQESEVRQ